MADTQVREFDMPVPGCWTAYPAGADEAGDYVHTPARVTSHPGSTYQFNFHHINDVTDADVRQAVAALAGEPRLTRLDMSGLDRVTAAAAVAAATTLPHLEELNLTGWSRLTPAAFDAIGRLAALADLNLEGAAAVGDADVRVLAGLPNLRRLILSGCDRVTDKGLAALAKATELRVLYLNGNGRLTAAGLKHLAGLPHLNNLGLAYCPGVTDAGLAHLDRLTGLTSLVLEGCPRVSDVTLARLAAKHDLRYLSVPNPTTVVQRLRLRLALWRHPAPDTFAGLLSQAGLTRYMQARPDCDMYVRKWFVPD